MPGSLFVAVGQDGVRVVSKDGSTWTEKQLGREGETYRSAAAGNGLIVATGSYGGDNIMAVTADGKSWKTAKHDAKYSKYLAGWRSAMAASSGSAAIRARWAGRSRSS